MQAVSLRWESWNPVSGCSHISDGCRHCYAERFAERWRGIPGHHYEHGFDLTLRPERLELPLHWKKPRHVFVTSMSDLFHEDIPDDYVCEVFAVMERAHWHVYHVLTKRERRLARLAPSLPWPPQIHMGVTIESMRYARRADALRDVPAALRHVSAEPLLGPLNELDLTGIDWVITGGESGPTRRPPRPEWLRGLRDHCLAQGVAFSFKGWGGRVQGAEGRLLDGRVWDLRPSFPGSDDESDGVGSTRGGGFSIHGAGAAGQAAPRQGSLWDE